MWIPIWISPYGCPYSWEWEYDFPLGKSYYFEIMKVMKEIINPVNPCLRICVNFGYYLKVYFENELFGLARMYCSINSLQLIEEKILRGRDLIKQSQLYLRNYVNFNTGVIIKNIRNMYYVSC